VSRAAAIPLRRRLPGALSNLPGRLGSGHRSRAKPLPALGPRRPYSVLLPVGFAVPPALPQARCALTAPFHPCRLAAAVCSLLHFPWACARRTLSGTAYPWSPDFPPAPPFGRWRRRPPGRL